MRARRSGTCMHMRGQQLVKGSKVVQVACIQQLGGLTDTCVADKGLVTKQLCSSYTYTHPHTRLPTPTDTNTNTYTHKHLHLEPPTNTSTHKHLHAYPYLHKHTRYQIK